MSSVNDQVTDSVSQIHTLLTGGAPSQAMGMLDVAGTETLGMTMFNAVTAQQNSQTSAGAALNASCAKILKTEIAPPPPSKSKEELKLELQKLEIEEEKLVSSLACQTIVELRKTNKLITQTSIAEAFKSACHDVEKGIKDEQKPLFVLAKKNLQTKINKIV